MYLLNQSALALGYFLNINIKSPCRSFKRTIVCIIKHTRFWFASNVRLFPCSADFSSALDRDIYEIKLGSADCCKCMLLRYLPISSGAHLWQLQGHQECIFSCSSSHIPLFAQVTQSWCWSSHSPQWKNFLLTAFISLNTARKSYVALAIYLQ